MDFATMHRMLVRSPKWPSKGPFRTGSMSSTQSRERPVGFFEPPVVLKIDVPLVGSPFQAMVTFLPTDLKILSRVGPVGVNTTTWIVWATSPPKPHDTGYRPVP